MLCAANCLSVFLLVSQSLNSVAGSPKTRKLFVPCPILLAKSYFHFLREIHLISRQIREGMTVVSTIPISESSENERAIILKIFSSIGRCRFLEEKHFDACTALSGSGPAFACIFLEAMADGGVMMGLPRAEALELAAQSHSIRF